MMITPPFSGTEHGGDLEDPFVACREQAFHVQFRARGEKPPLRRGNCFDVRLGGRGCGEERSLDFQESLVMEERANSVDEPGTKFEEEPFSCRFDVIFHVDQALTLST